MYCTLKSSRKTRHSLGSKLIVTLHRLTVALLVSSHAHTHTKQTLPVTGTTVTGTRELIKAGELPGEKVQFAFCIHFFCAPLLSLSPLFCTLVFITVCHHHPHQVILVWVAVTIAATRIATLLLWLSASRKSAFTFAVVDCLCLRLFHWVFVTVGLLALSRQSLANRQNCLGIAYYLSCKWIGWQYRSCLFHVLTFICYMCAVYLFIV